MCSIHDMLVGLIFKTTGTVLISSEVPYRYNCLLHIFSLSSYNCMKVKTPHKYLHLSSL